MKIPVKEVSITLKEKDGFVFLLADGFELGYITKNGLHLYTNLHDRLFSLGLNYNAQLGSLNVVYRDPY